MARRLANDKKDKSLAPGQALGFGLQYTRMTYRLLTSNEGSSVGFEVMDDTHVEHPNGSYILEQSKSSLNGNPLANLSPDLWKTLANWADIVENNNFDFNQLSLILYSSRGNPGSIANSFAYARTEESAQKALDDVKSLLWVYPKDGGTPKYKGGKKVKLHVERFFSKPGIAKKVISAFGYEKSYSTPENDLIKSYNQIHPEKRFAVAHHMCGWTKNRIDAQLRENKPAIIIKSDFFDEMHTYVRKYNERNILESLATNPSDLEQESLKLRLFIQQLELIELSFDERLEAIRKYFKSVSDRARWGNEGTVYRNSFDELDEELKDTWNNSKKIISLSFSEKDSITRGQLLLYKCLEYKTKLENCEVPHHFIPGCFHLLADEPTLSIGWHPEYKTELGKGA